ncbi:MAG: thiamine phosphate synthase [Crocinitomicaceae bacterium]|jgi:thiamine-phosphate pyrophosphorylase
MYKLQYISQGDTQEEQLTNIQKALEVGCRWVQLRFKKATPEILEQTAISAKELCEKYEALFIINDNVELGKKIDADGVHLGLTDTSIQEARELLGDKKIIGGTANTYDDVVQRYHEKCTYVGLGPFKFTTTKEKLSPIVGLEGYKEIITKLSKEGIQIPILAIGGILEEDIDSILEVGIYGIAVSGLITNNTSETLIKRVEELNLQPAQN